MSEKYESCELKKLVIDRSKWGKGSLLRGPRYKTLNDPLFREGRMCCLGHALLACGNTPKSIMDHGMPQNVHKVPSWIYDRIGNGLELGLTQTAYSAADINDYAAPSEKESKLIELFAENGCELSFVGELLSEDDKCR